MIGHDLGTDFFVISPIISLLEKIRHLKLGLNTREKPTYLFRVFLSSPLEARYSKNANASW